MNKLAAKTKPRGYLIELGKKEKKNLKRRGESERKRKIGLRVEVSRN